MFDVAYGRPQGLDLAESFLLEFPWQMFAESRVSVVDASNSLTLSLVSFVDERWFQRIFMYAEVAVVGKVRKASDVPLAADRFLVIQWILVVKRQAESQGMSV